MTEADLNAPELYISRELSWLEFNDRVLREGVSDTVALMERLKFLAIVSSNLDEFFMIRVAGLKQQVDARVTARDISGLTPQKQLEQISLRAHRMVQDQSAGIRMALGELAGKGIHVLHVRDLAPDQQRFLASYFAAEILPVLTPLAVGELDPFPALPSMALHLALALSGPGEQEERVKLAVVPIPRNLPRFITIPPAEGVQLVPLEDIVAHHVGQLLPGLKVSATAVFRVTRDADVSVDEDNAGDLLQVMEEAVRTRRRRGVVRLEVSTGADEQIRKWLMEWCKATDEDVYEIDGLLDASALMEIAHRPGSESLKQPDWAPQTPRDLVGQQDLWQALQNHDVLLFHPYESFEPVVRLIEQAADDPKVLAIKQTLYRTSGRSPIIAALVRAAEAGKEVTVLVELKARFDESRNITWARRLEDAGCHVIYGIAGLKTHGKLLLIIRREAHGIRRYVHLSTGNYNDRTARLYSDIGLMTSDRDFAADASAFFNLLTGYSQDVGWSKLTLAPTGLRRRFIELIERESQASTPDEPGLIMAKVNSLQDKRICQALYRAGRAGVKVLLNVRGICCLRPGLPGISENVEVTSVVDRCLEHARVFYFRNGGHEEVYLSSADWMTRNLDGRLEILFPVSQPNLKKRLIDMLRILFADNVKARRLRPDGTYERVTQGRGPAVRAQEELYRQAVEAARMSDQAPVEFRPIMRPDDNDRV